MVTTNSIIALALSFFSKEVFHIMISDTFREGWKVVPLLANAFVFHSLYIFFVAPVFAESSKLVPIISISSALTNIALNFLFIPHWGFLGAGVASLVSMIVLSIMSFVIGKRALDVGYPCGKMFGAVSGFFGLSCFSYFGFWPNFFFFSFKVTVFLVILLWFFLVYRAEVQKILLLLKGKKRSF